MPGYVFCTWVMINYHITVGGKMIASPGTFPEKILWRVTSTLKEYLEISVFQNVTLGNSRSLSESFSPRISLCRQINKSQRNRQVIHGSPESVSRKIEENVGFVRLSIIMQWRKGEMS